MHKYGVSFSIKQCRNFGLDWEATLEHTLGNLGARRFRLMSYWNEHEAEQGKYDFTTLDEQIRLISRYGGEISLCLGVRQPRWPENHWPDWAWDLDSSGRERALLNYLEVVVERYKDESSITSYQLENEALLEQFGERSDVDRRRLNLEFELIKKLDPNKPIIMTTSTSWGIPVRKPIPDIVGFSYYQTVYNNGQYNLSLHRPWLDKLRARTIKLIHQKPSFIHELQAEPWGPKNIWEMPLDEQFKSMSLAQLKENVRQANATKLNPIDLWGVEWWYWLKTQHNHPEFWSYAKELINNPT